MESHARLAISVEGMSAPVHPLMSRYLEAVLSGDREEALRVVLEEGFRKGESARVLDLDVVAATQREIGRLWQENKISVADEHQATAISQIVLSHLYPSLERAARVHKRVLVACVEGELHDMAARIATDLLDSYGFDTTFLGASCPTKELPPKIHQVKADALALSVTMSFHVHAAEEAVRWLRTVLPAAFPIILGGEAAIAIPTSIEGAIVSRGTAADLARTLREALGVPEVV